MLQKPRISKVEAEGLLGGIFMDTKGFQFKSGVRTFDAAAFLRSLGADTIEVKKMFTDSLEDYLLISETIKSAEVYDNLAIAVFRNNLIENMCKLYRYVDEPDKYKIEILEKYKDEKDLTISIFKKISEILGYEDGKIPGSAGGIVMKKIKDSKLTKQELYNSLLLLIIATNNAFLLSISIIYILLIYYVKKEIKIL